MLRTRFWYITHVELYKNFCTKSTRFTYHAKSWASSSHLAARLQIHWRQIEWAPLQSPQRRRRRRMLRMAVRKWGEGSQQLGTRSLTWLSLPVSAILSEIRLIRQLMLCRRKENVAISSHYEKKYTELFQLFQHDTYLQRSRKRNIKIQSRRQTARDCIDLWC